MERQAFLNGKETVPSHGHGAAHWHGDNLERLQNFERAIPNNEALAQNFFKVFRPKFDAARAVLKDHKKLYDQVNTNALAVPATSSRADVADMANWQKILGLEMGNPERLDALRLKSRCATRSNSLLV